MDPVTLALLIGGGLGAVQGIGSSMANNQQQKYNREQLDELMKLQASGGLGLTPDEQRLMDQQLMNPVQAAASQMQTAQQQALAASNGGASGAQLARLRQEQARTITGAQQQAASQILAADQARALQQKNEIEARQAAKAAYKQDDFNAILGGLSQLAGPIGMLAGAPPGTATASGKVGAKAAVPGAEPAPTSGLDASLGVDPLMRAPLSQGSIDAANPSIPGLSSSEARMLIDYYKTHPEEKPPGFVLPYMGG